MSDQAIELNKPAEGEKRLYTVGVEIANAITHGVWALLSVAGLVVAVVMAARRADAWYVVSFAIYGASAILLYTMSTLYHGITAPRAKRVLKILDHSSVFVLIAGTYTPLALTVLRPTVGWWVFGAVWACAVLGVALQPFLVGKAKFVSTVAYVFMGWIIVFAWKPFVAVAPQLSVRLLVAGGLAYTVGAGIYLMRRWKWAHPVFHLFVGAGSTLHFFAVLALLG